MFPSFHRRYGRFHLCFSPSTSSQKVRLVQIQYFLRFSRSVLIYLASPDRKRLDEFYGSIVCPSLFVWACHNARKLGENEIERTLETHLVQRTTRSQRALPLASMCIQYSHAHPIFNWYMLLLPSWLETNGYPIHFLDFLCVPIFIRASTSL